MDDGDRRQVLASLRLNWVMRSHGVWESAQEYVPQLHQRITAEVLQGVAEARQGDPLGLVLEGEAGTGKTHLLGWVREQVQQGGGYFFLVALAHGETFWESVLEAMLDGLWRPHAGNEVTQLQVLLTGLEARVGASRALRAAIEGRRISRTGLGKFVDKLGSQAGLRPEVRDTARALVLYAARDPGIQDLAKAYFLAADPEPQTRAEFGLGAARAPERIVQHLSQLLALTGHSVIAVDQLDPLIVRAASSPVTVDSSREDAGRDQLVNQVADGLMGLQEGTRHTLTLLTCIPNSWKLIKDRAVASAADRFRTPPLTLKRIQSPEVARSIVERQLTARYRALDFTPPYPSWPVRPAAFATAVGNTPRQLLKCIDAHARACLALGQVTELSSFDEPTGAGSEDGTTDRTDDEPTGRTAATGEPPEFAPLDARFEQLRQKAEVAVALDHRQEDRMMPLLLRAGLVAWVHERGASAQEYEPDPAPSSDPPLHAGLRQTLDERIEAQTHCGFRAIASPNALATQNRLRKAMIQSGLDAGDHVRRLFILRNGTWPGGPGTKTQALVADFVRRGGVKLDVSEDDLRTFDALRVLFDEQDPVLQSWLVARQPASSTALLHQALPHQALPVSPFPDSPNSPNSPDRSPEDGTCPDHPPDVPAISVAGADGRRSWLTLESLRKHVAVFAGSGSGKTVLLRRLIEECALQGVPSIVLDPNNDLARLGDAWPERPARGWREDDAQRAADYLADTDVVVWTPGREAGRPLTFQPLPDFTSVLDDPDEFRLAIDVAVSALAPRAGLLGRTTKVERQRAVLRQAVEHFARRGGGSLAELIDLLGDLPAEASTIRAAPTMAADLSETLTAATVNDPLFGGGGSAVDPGTLLTPVKGKRARVSVISFVGLPEEAQRQGFVSQLQMALFAWFKRHPAVDRPLGGLLVMDEAQTLAPSGVMTASTGSTLILVSQARKYGLGLVFATQAPKGLHNRIPGNAATQFFGYLNSPGQIATAREIARAKGGDVSDISRLRSGQFYVAREGTAFRRVTASNCLSHHPASPLSTDEVIARAHRA